MENIRPRHLFSSLLAFFILASFTRPFNNPVVLAENNTIVSNQNLQTPNSIGINTLESTNSFSVAPDKAMFVNQSATVASSSDSIAKNIIADEARIGQGIGEIRPLPVKPLPISIKPGLNSISALNDNLLDEKEYYRYDSIAHSFTKVIIDEQNMGFDPVRFRLFSSKQSVSAGEEVEIKIIAEFLEVSPRLIFQFEGSNEFTLKMLLPEGFVQTGGTYYDFVQGKVDKDNPKQEFTIKGFFESPEGEHCFSLLRSFAGAGANNVWLKKTNICLKSIHSKETISQSSITKQGKLRINSCSMNNCANPQTVAIDGCEKRYVYENMNGLGHEAQREIAPCQWCRTNTIDLQKCGKVSFFNGIEGHTGLIPNSVDGGMVVGFAASTTYDESIERTYTHFLPNRTYKVKYECAVFVGTSIKFVVSINGQDFPYTTHNNQFEPHAFTFSTGSSTNVSVKITSYSVSGISTNTGHINYTYSLLDNFRIFEDLPQGEKPTISPTNPVIFLNQSITLTATGCSGDVIWGNNTTANSITVQPNTNTQYKAKCDNSNICEEWSYTTVEVVSNSCKAETPTITSNGLQLTANGDCYAIVNGTPLPGTFSWYEYLSVTPIPQEQERTFTPTLNKTYQVRCVTSACESGLSDPFSFTCSTPTPIIEVPSSTTIPIDQTIKLETLSSCIGGFSWRKDGSYYGSGDEINAGVGCYTVVCNDCPSLISSEICIKSSTNTCGNFKVFAHSNATASACAVSAGEALVLYGGIEGNVSYDAIQWFFNGTLIPNSNSGAFIVKQQASVDDSGTYKVQVLKNGVWCEKSFTLTVCPCSFSTMPMYSFTGNAHSGTTTFISSNPCATCTHTWTLPNGTTRNVSGFTLTDSERMNGTYTLSVNKNGCISEGSIQVNTEVTPKYSSIITNAFCDNVSGWIKDENNPGRQITPLTLEYKNITANTNTVSVSINVTNYGYFTYPWSLPVNTTYEVRVKDPYGAYIGPYQTNPAIVQCCALALNPNLQEQTVCNTETRKGRYVVYLTGHSTTNVLQYRLYKKTYNANNFGTYTSVGSNWTTIPSGVAVPFIQIADLERGFYRLEIVEGTSTTSQGCKILTEFTIDCEPDISIECGEAPLITVLPDGIIQEGAGITPTLYAEPISTTSNTSTGLSKAAFLNGNNSIQLGNQDGTIGNAFEAWVKAESNKNITVGYIGAGEMHRFLFRYFATRNSPDEKFESILSVGSNGVTLIEDTHVAGSKRVAIGISKIMTGWNHIALVYRNHIPELYINGKLEGKASQSIFTINSVQEFTMHSAQIGYDKNLGFVGMVDEIRLWFSTLGATQALTSQTLTQNSQVRNNVPALSLDKYWTFENTNPIKSVANNNFNELKLENNVQVIPIPSAEDKAPQKQDYKWLLDGVKVGEGGYYTMATNEVKANSQTYVLQYTGDNGKTCEVEKTIKIKSCISISPNTTQNICEGTPLTLTASGNSGSTFNWYKVGQLTPVASNTATFNVPSSVEGDGIYYAVTNGCGSSDTESDRIEVKHTVINKPVASADPNPAVESTINNSTTVRLRGNYIGSNHTPVTYQWRGPNNFVSTLQNPSLLNVSKANHAGIYTLTLTQSANNLSCTSTATVKLTVNAVNCGLGVNATPSCVNGIGRIVVTVTGNTAGRTLDYSLDNQTWQSSNTFTNLLNGDYNVYVRSRTSGPIDQITEADFCYAITQQVIISCVPPTACAVDKKLLYQRWFLDDSYKNEHEINNFSGPVLNTIYAQSPRESIFTPNAVGNEKTFEIHDGTNQNFIARLRGFICPPVSGNYTFYLSADNSAKFYITTSTGTTELWAPNRPNNHDYKNESGQIHLTQGTKYIIEVVHRQGVSASFVKLSWKLENSVEQMVSADYLHPFSPIPPLGRCEDFTLTTNPNKIPEKVIEGTEIKVIAKTSSSNINNFIWSTADNTIYSAPKAETGTNSLSVANDIAVYLRPQISIITATEEEKTYKVTYNNAPAHCFKELKIKVIKQNCDCPTNDCDNIEILNPSLSNKFDDTKNFVAETVYLDENASTGAQTITYYDGLGRSSQKINVHAGPDQQDIVLPVVYDPLGRTNKTYLPYPAKSNNGAIIESPAAESEAWYGSKKSNGISFAQTIFEASPLNRPTKSSIVGDDISGSNYSEVKYGTNDGTYDGTNGGIIKKFSVTGLVVTVSSYASNTLYKVTSKQKAASVADLITTEYTDKEGKVVCKEVGGLKTYNVYNDFGQLVCVVPPKAIEKIPITNTFTLFSTSAVPINELVFAYEYNERGLMTRKKVPSSEEVTMAYYNEGTSKDMLQKTTEKRNNQLMETRFVYDELNRPINTFVKVNGQAELVVMSNNYDSYPDNQVGFTSRSFYSVDGTLPAIQTDKIKLKGLKISSWVLATKPDGTYNEGKKLGTMVYFDTKNRPVQTITKNYHGGNDINSTDFDFVSRARAEFTEVSVQGKSVGTKTRNGYDYGGRKTAICQKIDADNYSEKWQPIATYNYSDIGEMTGKILGCRTQVVDYEYNIKGWLTKINNPASLKVAATKEFDFFGMELTYSGDGNIKTQKYANAQRKYTTNSYNDVYDIESKSYDYSFGYDTQKRLTSANMSGSGKSFNLAMGAYDPNGNITTLQRTVNGTLVDNLEYKYPEETNLLKEIEERSGNRYFKGTSTYTYYSDGSLKNDSQKGITITYTANTLPAKILGGTNGYEYIYDATGKKLQTKVGTDTYDYAGNVVYLTKSGTTSIEFVGTPEGRWIPKEGLKTYNANKTENSTPAKYGRFEYVLKDHLGNSRVACRCVEKPTATTTTDQAYLPVETQTDHYDPWGVSLNADILPVALPDPLPSINKPQNRFTYNGKELQKDIGLFEYGFRWYDPMIARFTSVDPLVDDYAYKTPYDYAENKPTTGVDLDGLEYYYTANGAFLGHRTVDAHGMTLSREIQNSVRLSSGVVNSGKYTFYNNVVDLGTQHDVFLAFASLIHHESGIYDYPDKCMETMVIGNIVQKFIKDGGTSELEHLEDVVMYDNTVYQGAQQKLFTSFLKMSNDERNSRGAVEAAINAIGFSNGISMFKDYSGKANRWDGTDLVLAVEKNNHRTFTWTTDSKPLLLNYANKFKNWKGGVIDVNSIFNFSDSEKNKPIMQGIGTIGHTFFYFDPGGRGGYKQGNKERFNLNID